MLGTCCTNRLDISRYFWLNYSRNNFEKFTVKQGASENINERHCKILFRQGLTIAKWISTFSSENLAEEQIDVPLDLQEFDIYVKKSLDEIGEYLFSRPKDLFTRNHNKSDLSHEIKKLKKFFGSKRNLFKKRKSPK